MGIMEDCPSLSDRILGSARGLLESTFASVNSVETDFQSLRNIGNKGYTHARRSSGCSAVAQRPKRSGIAKKQRVSGSFRGDISATATSRKLEDEFNDFATSPLRLFPEEPKHNARYSEVELDVRTSTDSENGISETWHTGSEKDDPLLRAPTYLDAIEQDVTMDLSGLMIGDFSSSYHSTAARRIALVGDQLGREYVLQWHASEQARMLAEKVGCHEREMQRVKSRECSKSDAPLQHRTYIAQAPDSRHCCKGADDEEDYVNDFHCPYVGCYENFVWHNLNVSSEKQQRGCVHSGCAFISDSAHGWLEHIMSPHHDLQGGMHHEAGSAREDVEM